MDRYLPHLLNNQQMIRSVTRSVIDRASDNPEEIGAASYAYMELLGLTLYNFMWLRILAAVLPKLQAGSATRPTSPDWSRQRNSSLPGCCQNPALVDEIEAGAQTLMAMSAEEF